eukprot:g742.t1
MTSSASFSTKNLVYQSTVGIADRCTSSKISNSRGSAVRSWNTAISTSSVPVLEGDDIFEPGAAVQVRVWTFLNQARPCQ